MWWGKCDGADAAASSAQQLRTAETCADSTAGVKYNAEGQGLFVGFPFIYGFPFFQLSLLHEFSHLHA